MKHTFNFCKNYKILKALRNERVLKDDILISIIKLPETKSLEIIWSLEERGLIIGTQNHDRDIDMYDPSKNYRPKYNYKISKNGKNYYKNIFVKFLIVFLTTLILPIIIGVAINYFSKFI